MDINVLNAINAIFWTIFWKHLFIQFRENEGDTISM